MLKLPNLALTTYPPAVIATFRSRWVPLLISFAIPVYFLFLLYETELTNFIIPLFPDEPDKSFGFYRDFLRLCFQEMLWLSYFLLMTWILWTHPFVPAITWKTEDILVGGGATPVTIVSCLSFILPVLVAFYALNTFPNSADEYVYLYQAETLAEGKLVQKAHPLEDFFHFNHIAQKDGISVGRFPPGWPLLLTIPYLLNIPVYWMNPMLGALALIIFFSFVTRFYGRRVALWSLFILACTGYYIFNSASQFSHTSCLLFTIAFVYCIHLVSMEKMKAYSLLAGVFLGLIIVTRYYTAALIFLPVTISLFWRLRWHAIPVLIFVGLGSLPFLILLLWYNYQITGNAFLPVTVWADSTEAIGFVKGHTFLRASEYTLRRIFLFLYWCSPAILILYFVYIIQKVRNKTGRFEHPEDYFMIMLLGGYFFYHHLGGNQYGPRFVFEALPFAVVFVVNRALNSGSRLAVALLSAGLIYGVVKFPFILQRENRIVNERLDLYNTVRQAGISRAVVLVATHTGVIRPMPPRDLTRNDMTYTNDIIYAEDRGTLNGELMRFYPTRAFYRYVRDPEGAEGWLEPLKKP